MRAALPIVPLGRLGCYLTVLSISLWRVPVAPEAPTSLGLFVQLRAPRLYSSFVPSCIGLAALWGKPGFLCGGLVLSHRAHGAACCWACLGSLVLGPTFLRMGWTPPLHVVHCRGLSRLALSHSAPVGLLLWGAHPACGFEPLALRGALSCHGPDGLRYRWWGGMPHSPAQPIADAPCAEKGTLILTSLLEDLDSGSQTGLTLWLWKDEETSRTG